MFVRMKDGVADYPDLGPYFGPRTVALVGASEDSAKFGGKILKSLVNAGFSGRIYPVNGKGGLVSGLPAFASVRDIPEPVDHVGIAVPSQYVLDAIADCAANGAKFATIFTAGFGEASEAGMALQREAVRLARALGLRLVGPNCNGAVSFANRFVFTPTSAVQGDLAPAGRVGVVSQSGGAGQINVMWRAQQAGVGISHQVSCGNEGDVELFDFVRFMVEDSHTDIVLVVAERISNTRKMIEVAARAAELRKPIIIQKLGRSDAAQRAALSHTGSIAGADMIHDAAFRQFGLLRVRDANELYETAMLLRSGRLPTDGRLGAVSISGGNVVTIADCAPDYGLSFPEYAPETVATLARLVPAQTSFGNPTDLLPFSTRSADTFRAVLDTVLADPAIDVLVPILTAASASDLKVVSDVAASAAKPVALLWTGACNNDADMTPRGLTEKGAAVYRNFGSAMASVGRAVQYGRFLSRFDGDRRLERPAGADMHAVRGLLTEAHGVLTESESKAILGAYGFPITREKLATTADEAVAVAAWCGGPVAMKISSRDIPHKTEAGGVRLNVVGADALRAEFEDIIRSAQRYRPDARLDGVLVQEMVPEGVELLVGVSRDSGYGLVVTVGFGGTLVEVLADSAHRIPPFGDETAHAMLDDLRGRPLLDAFRGRPARDLPAVADLLARLSWFCTDFPDVIEELDLNPVVCLAEGSGCRIADALLVLSASPSAQPDRSNLGTLVFNE